MDPRQAHSGMTYFGPLGDDSKVVIPDSDRESSSSFVVVRVAKQSQKKQVKWEKLKNYFWRMLLPYLF